MRKPVVIVGAGIAGLVVARRLLQAGRPYLLLDADDRPGGRMKTDLLDGFRLDRGFQVFFTGYPTATQNLDMGALNLRRWVNGAHIFDGRGLRTVQFDRNDLSLVLFNRAIPWPDKFRLGGWAQAVEAMSEDDIAHAEDVTTEVYLRRWGFSETFLTRFLRPFYGGIFLDPGLSVSSRQFLWVSKMLLAGAAATPNSGIEAIPNQLATDLDPDAMRMRTRVAAILKEGDRAVGVRLANGEEIAAEAVVVATHASEAARLSGIATEAGPAKTCICVYYETPEPVARGPYLVLNGSGQGAVLHVAPVSNVAPGLAPGDRHLLAVTVLGEDKRSDHGIDLLVRKELGAWFPTQSPREWRHLRTYRVANAQIAQPPGFAEHRAPHLTPTPNLLLAGEFTENGSIEGAFRSGNACASLLVGEAAESAPA